MILQLRSIRKKRRMSQSDLAHAIGANLRTVGSWERGETMMSIEQLCNCCEALECTPNDLCGWYLEHPNIERDTPQYEDAYQEELNRCYLACTPERKGRILDTARDAALASGEAAKRAVLEAEEEGLIA